MLRCLIALFTIASMQATAGNYNFNYYFTQHTQNQLLYNPAYAGSTNKLNLHLRNMTILYKSPYTFDGAGAQNLSYAAFDMPIKKIRGALGAYMLSNTSNRTNGNLYELNAGLSYAYHLQIGMYHQLQFGVGTAYHRYHVADAFFGSSYGPSPVYVERFNSNYIDFSIGAWYKFAGLKIGLSGTHIGQIFVADDVIGIKERYKPVINGYISYKADLPEKMHIEPYFFATSARLMVPEWTEEVTFTSGLMVDYNDIFYFGLAYTHQKMVNPTIGFQIKKMVRVQGTYNRLVNGGSDQLPNFEVSMTLQLPAKEKPKKKQV